jgi:hypothetical protein
VSVLRLARPQPQLIARRVQSVARTPEQVAASDLRGDPIAVHPATAMGAEHLDHRLVQRHAVNVPRPAVAPLGGRAARGPDIDPKRKERAMHDRRAPLPDRLRALAEEFQRVAWERDARAGDEFLRDHAASLCEFAAQADEEYVRVGGDDEIPTTAQGVALARFLRGFMRGPKGPRAHALVSRAGAGLPEDYLHVRMDDGYEGGIAPDGATST